MKECKPIKLGGPVFPAQGKSVVAGGKHGEEKKGTKKYLPNDGWDALSADATPKSIKSCKKSNLEKSDKPVLSTKIANTIKSFS